MPSRAQGRVIVVGSSNTDLVVHCAKLPGAGETVLGGDMLTFAGGKGANQAVAAARAGAKVYFIGAFGDDAFGQARRADLEREGIDCSGCVVKKGVPSGVALIAIGKSHKGSKAENLIVVAPGANARLTPADVKKGMPRVLNTQDAVICSLEVPFNCIEIALKMAWPRSGNVILNPAPMPADGLPKVFLDHCHFITPNETEFELLTGAPVGSPSAIKKVAKLAGNHGLLYPEILVTRGPLGVDLYSQTCRDLKKEVARVVKELGRTPSKNEIDGYQPGFAKAPKVKVADTVGAGDCFNGALAAFLSYDDSVVNSAVEFAVAAASLKVTRHGSQAGMPYRHEILKMMKKLPRS
ncbi:MAG: ribokinase [Planctomycetes bacterium]|nr:ribokinase [Planctomycetota bacterium]